MNILIACDSFKGTLSSASASSAVAEGIKRAIPSANCICVSMADGGEGFANAYQAVIGGNMEETEVTGPYFEKTKAHVLISGDTAVIESAEAAGLLKSDRRDGENATTYGVGEMMRYALDRGYKRMIIGLGGSATSDCGIGALAALGAKLYDSDGKEIAPTLSGLIDLSECDITPLDARIKSTEVLLACDVKNPLCGVCGAVYVYGGQKGIKKAEMPRYERAHQRFAMITKECTGVSVADKPGCGAAGGLAAALHAYCGGMIISGAECLLEAVGFDKLVRNADVVISGEGSFDSQTASGKAVAAVARYAKRYGKPMLVFAGRSNADADSLVGITAVYSTGRQGDFETIKTHAYSDLASLAERVFRESESMPEQK